MLRKSARVLNSWNKLLLLLLLLLLLILFLLLFHG